MKSHGAEYRASETDRSLASRVTERAEGVDSRGEQRGSSGGGDGDGARGALYNGRGTWCVPPLNRSHPGLIFSLSAFDPSKLRCRYN